MMKLTVMIQRRWWSAVTKFPRSGRKVNTPGWRRLTSLPRWKDTKIRKMKISRGADLVWFVQKGPGNIEELWRSILYKLSIHILVIEWGIYFNLYYLLLYIIVVPPCCISVISIIIENFYFSFVYIQTRLL